MGYLAWVLLVALVSHNVVAPAMCCRHPRNNCQTPSPSHGSHGTPPSHGGGYGTPPSHGGGGSYGTPPSHGGSGSYGTPPSHGGSGGYYSPPCTTPPYSPAPVTPTPTPITPVTPTPTIPLVPPTPTLPLVPPTPFLPVTPPSPWFPDPNIPPITGTCDFWRTHPTLIWGILGYWGTIGGLFGSPMTTSIFGGNPTLPQALSSTRADGYGSLLREGAASLLNSMANNRFPFTTQQVRSSFVAALASEKAAADQAQHFKLANERRMKKN